MCKDMCKDMCLDKCASCEKLVSCAECLDAWKVAWYRYERAERLISDTELLMSEQRYMSAVNRLYYAVFSLMTCPLVLFGVPDIKEHAGVRKQYNNLCIRNKRAIRLETSNTVYTVNFPSPLTNKELDNLMTLRHQCDYEDRIIFEESDVKPYLDKAKSLLGGMHLWLNATAALTSTQVTIFGIK